jgi:SAM-dependent methyltransferase
MADPIDWIRDNLPLRETDSATALYDRMASQSGNRLPLINCPFDPDRRGHFMDRAQILDFTIVAGPGRVLDFGPGDGWPSLPMAPMVDEVVGVDGSARRVAVCTENARRLGIANATFVHMPPKVPLPFPDASFDGVAASSSIEQTPAPAATLREMARVLKPGGRLRMHYESLSYYVGGRERELKAIEFEPGTTDLLIFDRDLAGECVHHYLLTLQGERADMLALLGKPELPSLTPGVLAALQSRLRRASTWTTRHPSCRTWLRLLADAGFASARPTYDGGWFAGRLFDILGEHRPREVEAIDALLRPLVQVVVTMESPCVAQPGEWEPWITAVR